MAKADKVFALLFIMDNSFVLTTYLSESVFGHDLSQHVCGQLVCILPPGQKAWGVEGGHKTAVVPQGVNALWLVN